MLSLTRREQQLLDWLTNYLHTVHYPPTVRQMVQAMGYTSNAPIQALRKRLRKKGYITWVDRKPGTLQLCHSGDPNPSEPEYPLRQGQRSEPISRFAPIGLPLLGTIAAGAAVESFTDAPVEYIEVKSQFNRPDHYALRVIGDSMIDAGIFRNDVVILRRNPERWSLKPKGAIVAAYVEGEGTTLKYLEQLGDLVRLLPANREFQPIERPATQVHIQGVVVHLDRDYP